MSRLNLIAVAVLGLSQSLSAAEPGARIESVRDFFAGDRAGLEVGDEVVGWSHSDSTAIYPLRDPLELRDLEKHVHAIRPVSLHIKRGEQSLIVTPDEVNWAIGLRSRWSETRDADISAALLRLTEAEAETSLTELRRLATATEDDRHAAWLLIQAAAKLSNSGAHQLAEQIFDAALLRLKTQNAESIKAMIMTFKADTLRQQGRLDDAIALYEQAQKRFQRAAPDGLGVGRTHYELAGMAASRGQLDEAEQHALASIRIHERLTPGGLLLGNAYSRFARIEVNLERLDSARDYYSRAYQITETRNPGGVESSGMLNGLGIASYLSGDIAGAEQYWTLSLEMRQRLEPDSRNLAAILHNVALVNRQRGDYAEAEAYYQQSLEIAMRLEKDSVDTSRTLNNLGTLALEQGDIANAEAYQRQVYEFRKRVVPDSSDMAVTLNNLANIERKKGDLAQARQFYTEALAIHSRLTPGGSNHALALTGLSVIAKEGDRAGDATKLLLAARALYRSKVPDGAGVAEVERQLGELSLAGNDYGQAEVHFAAAHKILQRQSPASFREAQALHGLARVAVAQRRIDEAEALFEAALLALETQQSRLGSSEESRATIRGKFLGMYRDYAELLLRQGRPTEAFDIIERSRTKSLLDSLAQRDLVFDQDIPPDIEKKRRALAYQYEREQSRLLNESNPEAVASLQLDLVTIRRKQDELSREIKTLSPRLAALKNPNSIRFDEIENVLEPGTAAITFSVGAESTLVFVIDDKGRLHWSRIEAGESELRENITRLRYLLDAGRWDKSPSAPLLALAGDLYTQLLLPVEAHIESASKLLIIPDGPLNVLPFAVLVRQVDARSRYLAEWKPTLAVSSLSVYRELSSPSKRKRHAGVYAFGNPDYSQLSASATLASMTRGGDARKLGALPWSEREVENISRIFADDAAIFTGTAATEDQVKAIGTAPRVLHFATHAIVNELRPLDTALILSIPNAVDASTDNGFLQAWEVYEQVRLDADLVTLSGCETGLGTSLAGEGLMSLTRAFQYAGASTVLASLWNVNDRSTSELMTHFYANLRDDSDIAGALQKAQQAMIDGKSVTRSGWRQRLGRLFGSADTELTLAHPYHWAGFVVNGRGQLAGSDQVINEGKF